MRFWPKRPAKEQPPLEVPSNRRKFADISHYEKIDFDMYEYKDLLTKATDGNEKDNTLHSVREGCLRKDIRFGCYHFYRCSIDPIVQAKFYINYVGLENLKSFHYPPILDFETTEIGSNQDKDKMKANVSNMKKFLDYVENETGRIPIFYSYDFLIKFLELDQSYAKYPLWIANYSNEPKSFAPWKEYWAWQYAENAPYKGIGKCDGNVFKE